jgi:hypothetical protein
LARAFLREHSYKRLKLAQLLGWRGAVLTCGESQPRSLPRLTAMRKQATARAENRRFWCLSALRAHTKAPYKMYFHRKTLTNAKAA